jgi:hypothetical protein
MPKTEKDRPEDRPPEPPRRMTHEEFMQTLANDPQFRIVKPSGEGFIIGGQPPKKPEGA